MRPALVVTALAVLVIARLFSFGALDTAALDDVLAGELRRTGTPGAVVAVVSGAEVPFVRGVGLANVETKEAVDPMMTFRTASAGRCC